jgi:mannosyl-3-phosphoglycerate phosphatase
LIPNSRFQFNREVGLLSSVVVFTDLDGTLLDHDTYSYEAAAPALEEIRKRHIPLVIVTSKTRAEVSRLRDELNLPGENITENGARSRDYGWLCAQLREAAATVGVAIRAFHQMTSEEIAEAAGLPLEAARLASQREHAEPFQIPDADLTDALLPEIKRRGLRWTRGGRFYHVFESGGKGEAVSEMMRRYPGATSIGLGDAPNDIGLLKAVDFPVIVRSANTKKMREALPAAFVTPQPGPLGWNEALLQFFSSREGSPDRR